MNDNVPQRQLPKRHRGQRLAGAALVILAAGCQRSSPTAAEFECGPWPSQQSSPYNLPYPAGESHLVRQGNCSSPTHLRGTRDQYAYDFLMPIGNPVVAARDGVVEELEERYFDGNGIVSEVNFVLLRHDDGNASVYFHLTHNGVLVGLGDFVHQGQLIAHSGRTGGATTPHLHFGVLGSSGLTIPVTFRNTIAHPNGLQEGTTYPAF
jgi:murein DD-endopeptidase MepM/ murein hydrolase activator NlpD